MAKQAFFEERKFFSLMKKFLREQSSFYFAKHA